MADFTSWGLPLTQQTCSSTEGTSFSLYSPSITLAMAETKVFSALQELQLNVTCPFFSRLRLKVWLPRCLQNYPLSDLATWHRFVPVSWLSQLDLSRRDISRGGVETISYLCNFSTKSKPLLSPSFEYQFDLESILNFIIISNVWLKHYMADLRLMTELFYTEQTAEQNRPPPYSLRWNYNIHRIGSKSFCLIQSLLLWQIKIVQIVWNNCVLLYYYFLIFKYYFEYKQILYVK